MRVLRLQMNGKDLTVTGTTTDVYAVDFRNASTTLSEVLVWGAQGEQPILRNFLHTNKWRI